MKSDLVPLCGLWKKRSRENEDYFTGNINGFITVLIFKNKLKRPDSFDPDFQIYLAPNRNRIDPFTKKSSPIVEASEVKKHNIGQLKGSS